MVLVANCRAVFLGAVMRATGGNAKASCGRDTYLGEREGGFRVVVVFHVVCSTPPLIDVLHVKWYPRRERCQVPSEHLPVPSAPLDVTQ